MKSIHDFIDINLDVSRIEYSCRAWISQPSEHAGGLISFHGTYRYGSAGNEDALFMKWRIREFSEIRDPFRIQGLVVDLRGLDYEYGEDLDVSVRRLRIADKPVLVVVPSGRVDIFAGVIERERIRLDIDQAVEEVDLHLRNLRV